MTPGVLKMSDGKKTTKEVRLEGLRPELVPAIQNHLERHSLDPILSGALMVMQTDSERIKKALFVARFPLPAECLKPRPKTSIIP
jgi:hypothetical protein